MKTKLAVLTVLLFLSPTVYALTDIAVGPYGGMSFPVANDDAKSGPMYGAQARVSLMSMISLGAHFRTTQFGNPSQTFFSGFPDIQEVTMEKDGGDVSEFGFDLYLGGVGAGMTGGNFYLMGSIGSYKWSRDYVQKDVTKAVYSFGPGFEYVLPMKLGIEARTLFEIVPNGDGGSWKNAIWLIGANYHINIAPGY